MSKGEKLVAVLAGAVLVALLMVAGLAEAQTGLVEGSSPKFTANAPAVGWVTCWNQAGTDTTRGLALLEVSATTETKFTAWWWRSGKLPHKVKWPLYGPVAGDTTYIVPAGETRTFRWPKPWVSYLYVASGAAVFQGE